MRRPVPLTVWVACGSALGAGARWAVGLALGGGAVGFPWGTLAANVLGSFLIGGYAALTAPDARLAASPAQRAFVMAGFCGGFTTFSLFTVELLQCLQRGDIPLAAVILVVSVAAWLAGVWLGYAAGTRLARGPIRIREHTR